MKVGRPDYRTHSGVGTWGEGNPILCQIVDLDVSRVADALDFCVCAGTKAQDVEAQRQDSEGWLRQILSEWNPCGKLAYADGEAKGLILYLPAALFASRSLCNAYRNNPVEFPASWTERGVVVILCLWAKAKGRGIGGALLRAVLEELSEGREFRGAPCSEIGLMVFNPADEVHWPAGPVDFYRSFGFEVQQSDTASRRFWLTRAVHPPAQSRHS